MLGRWAVVRLYASERRWKRTGRGAVSGVLVSAALRRRERFFFFFQAEDGIRDYKVTGVQTCALPICARARREPWRRSAPTLRARAPRRSAGGCNSRAARGSRRPVGGGARSSREIGRASCRERV